MRSYYALPFALAALAVGADARAQSTVRHFDVRVSLGAGFHEGGALETVAAGPLLAGSLQLDWRPVSLLSLELELAAGYIPVGVPDGSNLPGFAFDGAVNLGAGIHLPIGLYLSLRGGAHDVFDELRGGMLAEIGWDIFATPGFSVGPFVRATYVFGADDREALGLFAGGVTLAFGPASPAQAAIHEEPAAPPPSDAPVHVDTTTSAPAPSSAPFEDGDRDGVSDDIDRCPASPPGATVDATGCPPGATHATGHHRPTHRRHHAH